MTWIKTVAVDESEEVRKAVESQRELYPIEYATPVHPTADGETAGIVASHSLIPNALFHAFATFGSLMSPDLPLDQTTARDDHDGGVGHEPVSLLNRVSRRVSASGYTGQGFGGGSRRRLPHRADLRAGESDARLCRADDARRDAHLARRSRTTCAQWF